MGIRANPDCFICECDGCGKSTYTRSESPPGGWINVSGTRIRPHPEDTMPWHVSKPHMTVSTSGLYCSSTCLLARVKEWAAEEKAATEETA